MNTTEFRNIHVARRAPVLAAETDAKGQSGSDRLPRLRLVTNDPAREYNSRPGEIERLPDAVAALFLSKQGEAKVQRNGIKIELAGRKLCFWSEGSITIATKADTNEKVLWTLNRQQPEMLHILTPCGKYIESIPIDEKAPWFDEVAAAQVIGSKTRANNRRISRIRQLHASDTRAVVDRVMHNEAQIGQIASIRGVVQTFPNRVDDGRTEKQRIPQHRKKDKITAPTADRESISRAELLGVDRLMANDAAGLISRSPDSARDSLSDRANARAAFPTANRLHEIQQATAKRRATRKSEALAAVRETGTLSELVDDRSPATTSPSTDFAPDDDRGSLRDFM